MALIDGDQVLFATLFVACAAQVVDKSGQVGDMDGWNGVIAFADDWQ